MRMFRAALVLAAGPLKWTGVHIPFDAAKLWGQRGQIRVRGSINGFAFRTTLFPTGDGGHFLLVNKAMQKGGHAQRGDVARFELEPDAQERPLQIPPELEKILRSSKAMGKLFDALNVSLRRYFCAEVGKGKSPQTRTRRADQLAEQMLETLEAERELPPLLQRAFEENPRARAGWKRMTPLQRRHQLLAIFYYRNPASRGRRLAKAMGEAAKRADGARGAD